MSRLAELKADAALVAKLPAAAAFRYRTLENGSDTERARGHFLYEKAQDARLIWDAAEHALVRFDTHYANQPVMNQRVHAKERATLEETITLARVAYEKRERERENDRQAERASPVFMRLRRWLEANANRTFAAVPLPAVKRAGKENWSDAVERIRAEIITARAALERAQNAPLPSSMAKAAASAQVAALAKEGRAEISRLFDGKPFLFAGEAHWPGGEDRINPRHLLAWLAPEMMVARIHEQIDAEADDAEALTPSEKPKAIALREVELLELERVEEAMIVAGEGDFLSIPRRADADPRALLSLASTVPGYSDED